MEPTAARPIAEQPAIAVTPGEGTFDSTPTWERFEKHQAAEKEQVEKPVEQKTEPKAEENPVEEKPKEEVKPEAVEGEKLPKMSENAGKAFAALKAEVKELREKRLPESEKMANEHKIALEEAKKRLAEFEGKDISQYEKKIAELESKFTEAEKFRAIHDVSNSDAYKQEVLYPAEKIGQDVDILAKMYPDTDVSALKSALQIEDRAEQRKRLKELTDGWDTIESQELLMAASKTRQLLEKSQSMLANAEKTKSELRFIEEQEGKRKAEADEQMQKASNESVNKMYAEKVALLKDSPELAEAVKNAVPSKEVARQYSAAKAELILPHALETIDKLKAEVAAMKEEKAKRAAAKPNPSAANSQETKTVETQPGGYSSDDVHSRWLAFKGA